MNNISIATTDAAIRNCFAVMVQLRPQLSEDEFVARVKQQMQAGYRLAYIKNDDHVVAVAGFRIGDNLAWGRFLYIDDLVTDSRRRSHGYGKCLLAWLKDEAKREGCAQLHLDSGMQRKEAHRFYEREGISAVSHHFAVTEL